MTDTVYAWCECGHTETWHFEGGPCSFIQSYWNHETGQAEDRADCDCGQLVIAHVDVHGGL